MSPCVISTTQLLVVNKATFTSIKATLATSCFPGNRSNIPRWTPPAPPPQNLLPDLSWVRQQGRFLDNKRSGRTIKKKKNKGETGWALYRASTFMPRLPLLLLPFSCVDEWINWVQVSGDTQESWLTLPRGWWQFCTINNPSGDHYRAAEGAHYSIYVVFRCIGGCN